MSDNKFVPLIVSAESDSNKAAKAALRELITALLGIRQCADAIVPFKSNGTVMGHKVLDDYAAVEALVKSAPAELAEQIDSSRLLPWEKCQVLNQVLRRHFELDKKGKLTGQPSKRALLQQQKSTQQAA